MMRYDGMNQETKFLKFNFDELGDVRALKMEEVCCKIAFCCQKRRKQVDHG